MRTLMFIVAGPALWGLLVGLATLFAGHTAVSVTIATVIFIVVWFAAAAVNMWVGVNKAGYSSAEEFPIFLLIFLLPVLLAIVVRWKWL
jgi:hypothetical protein